MRTDLNMRKGKMAAQAAHASREFLSRHVVDGNGLTEDMLAWLEGYHDTICVGVDSAQALSDLYAAAINANLPAHIMLDLGKTEFHGVETPTCLAIGPGDAEEINAITGHLKLL